MAEMDAIESLTTFRHGREGRGQGAILFDGARLRHAQPEWFSPGHWGMRAQPVQSGGRGGAWFVDAPFGQAVLRLYLRGGMAARISRDRYLWRGEARVRSFAEYRLTEVLLQRGLPVPRPIAAHYQREGMSYRAAILLDRLPEVRTFSRCIDALGDDAPWEHAGRLIARFHLAGLDHADLNADNLLFDGSGGGWMIDFDRGRLRKTGDAWRRNNLTRLLRSLHKLRGARSREQVQAGYARLHAAYRAAMGQGA